MSITDELREFADKLSESAARQSEHGFSPIGMRLERIADSIDEKHERALAKQHVVGGLAVNVQPHIDWSRMADELEEAAKAVRGMRDE